ncbi:hypothetical protein N7457_000589 [Penicillium paradoxum]|uniref:uncharacterized protein n=1 Tax=Penicillium paradoxum TaxID=176176 RepID=UPI0025493A75|nr:uncharacterized protein N7457_000589 [Penicillium paradoxum]KAJ5793990.1 hypothetical protein N7457_000589 [Penicillium paradoxum]
MNQTPKQVLDIEDALVTEDNPARDDKSLDYERCARLHNYLVAYAWMARHDQQMPDLNELASQRSRLFGEDEEALRARLVPSMNSFLDSIYVPSDSFFYWVDGISMMFIDDEIFMDEKNELEDKERFFVIYDTECNLGPHNLGVVYDQQLHRAAFPMTIWNTGSLEPISEHEEMWFPLETILTHWIYMIRIGKVTVDSPEGEAPLEVAMTRSQIGLWSWLPYCAFQVDSTVAAMDRYTAAIEARMPPDSLLPVSRDTPLFTDADLDGASVPEECFIRSLLTRMKTPRFKAIAPGLEVPHDVAAFVARQRFTDVVRHEEAWVRTSPAVLIFAAKEGNHQINFRDEIRHLFFEFGDEIPYTDQDLIPAGLYSESVCRTASDSEEAGFRLVLPFELRPRGFSDKEGAIRSDGSPVSSGSVAELFQHGGFHPFGGEHRAQRLERLLDRWRELVESGVWTVGKDGVEGEITQFQDADRDAWRDYFIPPDW